MDINNYQFSSGTHLEKKVIWVHFSNEISLKQKLKKKFPRAKWSKADNAWFLPDIKSVRVALNLSPKQIPLKIKDAISLKNQKALQNYMDQLEALGYSGNSIQLYVQEFTRLLVLLKGVGVDTLSSDRLKDYFLYTLKKDKVKEQSLNSKINAIKFYYEKVLNRPRKFVDIPRPKSRQELPKMLSKSNVKKLFSVIENPKHLILTKLCYGLGLSVTNIVNVKLEDVDKSAKTIVVRGMKGRQDRSIKLTKEILEELKMYIKQYKPKYWLFEGMYGDKYSVRSVQSVFKSAFDKAQISKTTGKHGFSHNYATNLIEAGADTSFMKEIQRKPFKI